jgi:hypothetical protein
MSGETRGVSSSMVPFHLPFFNLIVFPGPRVRPILALVIGALGSYILGVGYGISSPRMSSPPALHAGIIVLRERVCSTGGGKYRAPSI